MLVTCAELCDAVMILGASTPASPLILLLGLRLCFELGRTLSPLCGRAFMLEMFAEDRDLMIVCCCSSSSFVRSSLY